MAGACPVECDDLAGMSASHCAGGADSHRRSQWRMGTDTMFILGNAISSNDF